jgi:hypothetical protein
MSVLFLALLAMPVNARLWKPTPQQLVADYVTITHIKSPEERVLLGWLASPVVAAPTLKPLLDKYVVISIMHTRTAGGQVSWEQVQGVQLSDGDGQLLKQVPGDTIPPAIVGLMAASDATMKQGTQGQGKVYWSVWDAGSVAACQKSKLVVTYDGEAYSWDTPLPGCPKP